MSDHKERAYLKDRFKDFGAASDPVTKNAVMSEIQKNRRKKRFFIIFFLSAFVVIISTIATVHYNEGSNTQLNEIHAKKSNKEVSKSTQPTSKGTASFNDKNQKDVSKENVSSNKKVHDTKNNRPALSGDSQSIDSEKGGESTHTKRVLVNPDKKEMKSTSPGNEQSRPNKKRLANAAKSNQEDHKTGGHKKHINDNHKVNTLALKLLSFPQPAEEYSRLTDFEPESSRVNRNKWIIGFSYTYLNFNSGEVDDQPVSAGFQLQNYNNEPNEFLPGQEIQSVRNSVNLELSVIRKFKNKFYLESGIRYTKLNSITSSHKMADHLLGIPLKVGFSTPLKGRWALDVSTGMNYNLSISRTEKNIDLNTKKTHGNFTNFQLSTAEINLGISYFINEKFSVKLSPQLSYLLFYKEQNSVRYFHRSLWLGGQLGIYFHLN